MELKVIKPNIFLATFSQLLVLAAYFMVIFTTVKVLNILLGFDMVSFFLSTVASVDGRYMPIVIDSIKDPVTEIILIIFPSVLLFFMNLVNQGIKIEDKKIIVKKGLIKISKQEFYPEDVIGFRIERAFGFRNSGSVFLSTRLGKEIEINYLTNLRKVSSSLDGLIKKNKSNSKGSSNPQ